MLVITNRIIASLNHLVCFSRLAKPEGVVSEQLHMG